MSSQAHADRSFLDRVYSTYDSHFKRHLPKSHLQTPKAHRNRSYLRRKLAPVLASTPTDQPIADLGCGDGTHLLVLKELGFSNLHGVEGSEEMWSLAVSHCSQVIHGDLREFLKNSSQPFAAVMMFDVLEHFSKEKGLELLDLIAARLQPNGILILQLPNADSPHYSSVFAGDLTHEAHYSPSSLRHLLACAGFQVIRFEEHAPHPRDLPSLIRWLLWKGLRMVYRLQNLIETGRSGSGVHTRVMRAYSRLA